MVLSSFLQELCDKVEATASDAQETSGTYFVNETSSLHLWTLRMKARLWITIQAIIPEVAGAEEKKGTYDDQAVRAWLHELMDAAHIANGIVDRFSLDSHDVARTSREKLQEDRPDSIMTKDIRIIVRRLERITRKGLRVTGGSRRRLEIFKEIERHLSEALSSRQVRRRDCYDWFRELNSQLLMDIATIGKPDEYNEIIVSGRSGQWLEELKGLGKLRGELRIFHLPNINSRAEAARALLIKKKHLHTLDLEWGQGNEWDGRPRDLDDKVLEGFRPHPNLKKLVIRDHCGTKLPSWMENQWLSGLETVELHSCPSWNLGKLPSLKHLYMKYTREDLQTIEGREEEDQDAQLFPSLRVLIISHCFRLENLPHLPPTLKELHINEVGIKALPELWACDGIKTSSSLSSIHISHLYNLTTLGPGLLRYRLEALESLTIRNCYRLKSFPVNGFRSLVTLKSLTLEDCNELSWSPENEGCLPSSLVDLKIIKCRVISTDSFFMGLQNLTSLSSLYIEEHSYRPRLESLPVESCHLTALTELELKNCPKLVKFGLQALASLRRLKIHGCYNLVSPPRLFDSCAPLQLEYLEIECSNLQFLTYELLQSLTSLRELRISRSVFSRNVERGLCCLSSLKKLCIATCCSLHSLPSELQSLNSLEELCITDSHLKSLPEKGFPTSLMKLVIHRLRLSPNKLQKGGSEWLKIAHILYVEINKNIIETQASKQL